MPSASRNPSSVGVTPANRSGISIISSIAARTAVPRRRGHRVAPTSPTAAVDVGRADHVECRRGATGPLGDGDGVLDRPERAGNREAGKAG